jgi:hypothetical protein
MFGWIIIFYCDEESDGQQCEQIPQCHSEMVHVTNGLNIILTTHSYPLNNIVIVTLNQLHSSPFSVHSVD